MAASSPKPERITLGCSDMELLARGKRNETCRTVQGLESVEVRHVDQSLCRTAADRGPAGPGRRCLAGAVSGLGAAANLVQHDPRSGGRGQRAAAPGIVVQLPAELLLH